MSRGVPFDQAAEEVGIPIEEARDWAKDKCSNPSFASLILESTAHSALQVSLHVLQETAIKASTYEIRERAANNLSKLAIQLLRTAGVRPEREVSAGDYDLFDKSPFHFKNDKKD